MAKKKTPKIKKKSPKKTKITPLPNGRELSEAVTLTEPLSPPEEGFHLVQAAQECLDRLGAAIPSVQSDGTIVRWVRETDYTAIEHRLSRIIEGG
jgi:hypothetical protein